MFDAVARRGVAAYFYFLYTYPNHESEYWNDASYLLVSLDLMVNKSEHR